MFDFFHKHKTNTATHINPQTKTTINPNSQTSYVQTNTAYQGQNLVQTNPNIQANSYISATPTSNVQAQINPNIQAQNNNQKVVVNPLPIVQTTTSNPNANVRAFTDDELEMAEMVNNLTAAILGYSPADIPELNRQQAIQACMKIFSDFMIKFVELKYGTQDATRLKASQKFNDGTVFMKFTDLGPKFDDAYTTFLDMIDKRWDKVATST
jgi:hypothetical protein